MFCTSRFPISLVVAIALGWAGAARAELVGWWAFDEGSGTDILDSSGFGNHGTVHDDVQWSDGRIGLALEFAGANGHCEIPFSDSLKILNQGDFTIAAWILLNTVPPSTNRLVLQQNDLNGTGRSLLFVHSSNEIRSFAGGAATGSGVAMEAGEWYHAAVIVTELGATDSIQMYVNGQASGAANTTLGMESCEGLYHIGSHKNVANNVWDGRIDDLRIYNHALSDVEMLAAMEGGGGGFPFAHSPEPANGAIHSSTWANVGWSPGDSVVSHDVYMGTSFDDVDAGAADTFVGNQTTTSLIVGFPGFPFPAGLEAGVTYYWRIDEVNDADPNSPWKGDIWGFSVPPKTAFAPDPADGAQFVDPNAILSWTPGFGGMLHTVYIGTSFDEVNNAAGGAAQGDAKFSPGPLESEKVYYWRVDEFDGAATHKGDVWAFTTPGAAGAPQPTDGAVGAAQIQVLSWDPADNAISHDLYFGQDKDAVANATKASPEFKGNRASGAESYDAGKLPWNATYYWRVDAVYAGETIKGLPWTFTTADFLLVDDFESYNDIDPPDPNSNRIFEAWADGFGVATNGALVGNDLPPYAEQGVVHGGNQSMPYSYDNNMMISEATKTLVYPTDWTEAGVTTLSLWFRGGLANSAEPMFVALNGNAVVYHEDADATQMAKWTEWVIDLQAFADQGLALTNVNTITIGFGTKGAPVAGGAGKMYFDDIRLLRPAESPQP
ncbi:MAG: LamG domain-containing protein [Phycisphaerales bacterium]|nr:MAG: LamG domain-containing protein [Phycisphaerales bacterium]